jgi:hypothetical protein
MGLMKDVTIAITLVGDLLGVGLEQRTATLHE